MPLLLCAATEFEIAPTRRFLSENGLSNQVRILITGVGLLPAVYALTKAATTGYYSTLLQAGVAGCFDNNETLGKVVAVKTETVGDSGVEENGNFKTLFDLNLVEGNNLPWTQQKLMNEHKNLLALTHLPQVAGITVNEISTSEAKINYYRHTVGAAVESLEGAALHYVGIAEKIPFLQLRSLSNFAGERDKKKWAMPDAITNLNVTLQSLILKLLTE